MISLGGDDMRRKLIPFILIMLFILCACSGRSGGISFFSESDVVLSTADIIEEKEPERDGYGRLKCFETKLQQYPAMVGWITVPNTIIDYPVVQGTDNDYYLSHDYKGDESRNGAVYVDFRAHVGLEDTTRNVVIHGHHMKSGVMFANITRYDDPDFYRQNPVIRFDSIYHEGEWLVFAEMKIDAYGGKDGFPTFDFMQCHFNDDAAFMTFVNDVRAHSVYDTYELIDVTADDNILTMSTCSYEFDDCRTVLVARRLRKGEKAPDMSAVKFAENPIMPPAWGNWEGHL